jgi:hypothetical protein
MEEGLGRDAALVQAGAAELALLDQGNVQAQLRCPQGACVAAAATAEDDDVENGAGGFRHGVLLGLFGSLILSPRAAHRAIGCGG